MLTPKQSSIGLLILIILIGLLLPSLSFAGACIGYSLAEAQRKIGDGADRPLKIFTLGGITQPIGIVYDPHKRDLILVGEVDATKPALTLDDFAVALRSVVNQHTDPLVSIDRTSETDKTRMQTVRFEGGIENTRFGKDLLDADIVLKKMGLGKLPTNIWGIRSYFETSAEQWKKTGKGDAVCSRFWFKSSPESYIAVREGVAVIDRVKILVDSALVSVSSSSGGKGGNAAQRDELADRFAAEVTANFDDITAAYPQLRRLEPLFRLTGLAQGIGKQDDFKMD